MHLAKICSVSSLNSCSASKHLGPVTQQALADADANLSDNAPGWVIMSVLLCRRRWSCWAAHQAWPQSVRRSRVRASLSFSLLCNACMLRCGITGSGKAESCACHSCKPSLLSVKNSSGQLLLTEETVGKEAVLCKS